MNFIFLLIIFLLFGYVIFDYFRQRKSRAQTEGYVQQLERAQEHALSLEKLISMLIEIHELGMSVGLSYEQKEIYQKILIYACRLMGSEKGSLLIFDEETNELKVAANLGLSIFEPRAIKFSEGFASEVIQSSKPVFVENITRDERFLSETEKEYYPQCFISTPLKAKRGVIGMINVSVEEGRYPEDKVNLLGILANMSAVTLENVELYQNLQIFYLETVQILSRAIDAKDAYTGEHADRSRRYAHAIAKELNLPEMVAKNVEYAALLHDIGKMGIEESILGKPGKLTSEERESIKKHPIIGKKLLAPVTLLAPVVPMILYHHEWYNGHGYLEGLKGEEIPLGARIVALIDAWDAMTSDRPYRKALSKAQAIEEIRKGSGTQFDPKVVDAFLKILEKEDVTRQG